MSEPAAHPSPAGQLRLLSARGLGASGRLLERLLERWGDVPRVLRFLAGWLEFEARPDDIFVVSYPRSGTTWTQMILHQLTTDGSLDFAHLSQVSPWFERALARGTQRVADFDALPSPRIFKSHLTWEWIPKGARYVYLLRDGTDVAVSYYHLYRSHLGFGGSFDHFFDRFLAGRLQYRSWFDHASGWRAQQGRADVLMLRFENMCASLEREVDRLAAFCGHPLAPARRAPVLERCRFEFMKAHEDKFDHATQLLLDRGLRPGAFLRRGRPGEGQLALSPAQRARFERLLARPQRAALPSLDLAAFLH